MRAARSALIQSLDRQANEGRVLSQTLWNHHFYEESDKLRPSGQLQLERLARKFPHGCPEIFIQSAQDVALENEKYDEYFKARKELDEQRLQAVNNYLQRRLPGQAVAIQLHDRPPVGISAEEVIRGQAQLRATTSGLLPPSITQSSFYFGAGGGGGGGPSLDMGGPGGPGGLPPSILSGSSGGFASDVQTQQPPPSSGGQQPPSPPPPM